MAKIKKAYFCSACGNESPKWVGKCPACGEWNTYVEEIIGSGPAVTSAATLAGITGERNRPLPIHTIQRSEVERRDLGSAEVNRVLGGGLVPGSLVLIGGEPGIGKSTLVLQIAVRLAGTPILYVSGEESPEQIKMRADRLGVRNQRCLLLGETSLENIMTAIAGLSEEPALVVIDSIQTLYSERIESSPGSVSQVRECAAQLLRYAKESGVPVILIGHITKEGSIAGPKVLEHIVDVVFQIEGDENNTYRILRSIKNRFGATHEIGVFEMCEDGMREVDNPSSILVSHYDSPLSGIAVAASLEGIRPFMIETQALVSNSAYGTPQRSATGIDYKRLNMLLAVLEKRLGYKLGTKDVFLNLTGGFKVADTGLDLAIVAAIISSGLDIPLPSTVCFAGEVGLSGEVRPAARTEQRLSEAARLGFGTAVVSAYARKALEKTKIQGLEVVYVSRVDELAKRLFSEK